MRENEQRTMDRGGQWVVGERELVVCGALDIRSVGVFFFSQLIRAGGDNSCEQYSRYVTETTFLTECLRRRTPETDAEFPNLPITIP